MKTEQENTAPTSYQLTADISQLMKMESDSVPEVPLGTEHEVTDESSTQQTTSSQNYKKYTLAFFLVAFVVFVILDSTIGNGWITDGVDAFLEWIEENPGGGIFVFVLVYFAATVLFVPGSILTLGAGFVFANAYGLGVGVLLGTLAVFVGASAGAIVAFVLGRFLLREWVGGLATKYAIFAALDSALAEKGFRIMVLLRLSPIIPFNALNYIAGVTAIGFWEYVWALFAILPGSILYVFLGASAGSLADSASSGDSKVVTIVVIVVGVVFGILAVGVTSYYAKQELNKVTQARNEAMEAESESDKQDEEAAEPVDIVQDLSN